jgi:ABC-2 type transport system ATP-binding protein
MLQITALSKSYHGKKNACDNINLTIEKGDIFGFIGHNGAGKTTLLKSIVSIHNFDAGDILIDGISIKTDPLEAKKRVAYIPDQPEIYDSLSGNEYLQFIADVFSIDMVQRKIEIEKLGKMFEILDVLNNPISSYSHGMKQKLIIISALIHHPKLLVMDEPFVGLDPKASFLLKEIFKEMCQNGAAIFFSTHVLEVAEKLCNKIAIIKEGKIVACGKTEEIIKDKTLENIFMAIANEG